MDTRLMTCIEQLKLLTYFGKVCEMPPKVIRTDPPKLSASVGARSAAKLRSKSDASSVNVAELRSELNHQWEPTTWQSKPIVQDVVYNDYEPVEKALQKLESLPPLVHPREVEQLKSKLADAALGKAFVLQGGDCAELFDYCTQEMIENKLKVLLQMSLVLIHGINKPVVRIGRIAGQYAKPRSKLTEMNEELGEIPSFRGDNINGFDVHDRSPDPDRLVKSYFHSAATLNFIRATLSNGFADLHDPIQWNLEHIQHTKIRERYEAVVNSITEGIKFMKTVGADQSPSFNTVDFFTSHEALLLEYEQSLTRLLTNPSTGKKEWYNTSSHFVWIGDRTRQPDGAHVEFFRGLANPVGIKVGPTTKTSELIKLLDIVDPEKIPGKVTLISRYGATKIAELLPGHIRAVKESGHIPCWISDPCHGNTKTSPFSKLKTRYVDDIVSELKQALEIHKANDSQLNGVHLELTGDDVTECVGGTQELEDKDLVLRYDTVCDPRLSLNQSLDVAFLVSDYFKGGNLMQ